MKIALVYDAIYPYLKGGGEKRFYEVGKKLAQKGHQVHLYGMKFWEGDNIIKMDNLYLHGICEEKRLYTKKGKRSILQAIYFGCHSMKLIVEDFDVIDCCAFPYFSLFACKLVSLIKKKHLYATWHEVWGKNYWYEYIGWKGLAGYMFEKLATLMPEEIISVSRHTTEKLKNELHSKNIISTITNGIEIELIESINPAIEESEVIFTGRLLMHKNIDVLIKSIHLVKEKIPHIRCLIIGSGPELESLEALTQELGLRNNIKFLGFLEKQEDVYALMKSSRVFVLPSTREGFGMVVIEANACGIPVITVNYKDNAAKELIEDGENGFVCPLIAQKIAERILEILNNNLNHRMRKTCKDLAQKYNWDKIVNEIERVYVG